MEFKDFLERNGLNTTGCEASWRATPAAPFFLEPDYLRNCARLAGLPEDLTSEITELAAELAKESFTRAFAWHLYRLYCVLPDFKVFPDHIDITGSRTGLLYLIILFSVYPHVQLKMQLEGLPAELADRVLERPMPLLGDRSIYYPGEKGFLGRALPFILNYKNAPCYRIGRFDFVITQCPYTYPELFRHRQSRKYTALCRAGWKAAPSGYLLNADDESVPPVEWSENGNTITGRKIDLAAGRVTAETVTLDLAEYERLTPPESSVLLMHIPGGGGMTQEKCQASFKEAREFCQKYFPDLKIAAFGCISWVFNPAWRKYLPDSNLSKLQKATLAFPFTPNAKSGLVFLFGRDDWSDPEAYPADNSQRRAMLQAWKNNELRSGGMLLPFDEIDNFPLDQDHCIQ